MAYIFILTLCLVCLAATALAQGTGATINEKNVQQVLYVNSTGADTGSGEKVSPFSTISAAVAQAATVSDRGVGVRIKVSPGVYRESIVFPAMTQAACAPIILEATAPGMVLVTGADRWDDGWNRLTIPSILYQHAWPLALEMGPNIWEEVGVPHAFMPPITRHKELIFVNGTLIRQVLSPDGVAPGTFCVQQDQQSVLLSPPQGVLLGGTDVEVGVRDVLLSIHQRDNVVIRGIDFTRSVNYVTEGAIRLREAKNIMVDRCRVEWNNGDGISINECEHLTLRAVDASHNGMNGISIGQAKNVLVENLVTNENCWRGAQGDFTYWATAGMKACRLHNATIRDYTATKNSCPGLWLDFDIQNVSIERFHSKDNAQEGVLIEACDGPVTIHDSVMQNNYVGVFLAWARHVTLEHCVIRDNMLQQISLAGDRTNARSETDWESGATRQLVTERCTLRGNVIAADAPQMHLFGVRFGENTVIESFVQTLEADCNRYFHSQSQQAFPDMKNNPIDLAGWKMLTHQDKRSEWGRP